MYISSFGHFLCPSWDKVAVAHGTRGFLARCVDLVAAGTSSSRKSHSRSVATRCVGIGGRPGSYLAGSSSSHLYQGSRLSIPMKGARCLSTTTGEQSQPGRTQEDRYRFPRLGKRALKKVRSIERLYRPITEGTDHGDGDHDIITESSTVNLEPGRHTSTVLEVSKDSTVDRDYEPTKRLVKSIYKSASAGVMNDALWSRYVHKLSIVAGVLHTADICLVMYSFAKVRYRDQQLLKILSPLIVHNMANMSCGGAALILNSMKRLEISNYDIIELATNEICLKMDHANLQDIALTANALSFFQVYHNRFWNMLTKAVSIRHHQITALQASLILAAVAKLDLRNPLLLRILKDKLRPVVERGELNQELLSLVFHSLAKLDFSARRFYDSCSEQFGRMLDEEPEKVDSQSLVLYLYTAVCVLGITDDTIAKSLNILAKRKDVLKNYKALKLKYVFDFLKHRSSNIVDGFDQELRELQHRVQEYEPKKLQRKLSRWAMEISRLLHAHGVKHSRNVALDQIYIDIFLRDKKVAVKCAGPYSYYAMSNKLTVFAQVEIDTLEMKGIKVCVLPYHEWNALRSEDDKLDYLKKFGESWNAVHFPEPNE